MSQRKPKNTPIGTCECPMKGCAETVPVFRFRQSHENPNMNRQAGKLYVVCPSHGMSQAQEWILAHADITGEPPPEPNTTPESAPAGERETPKPGDDSKTGQPSPPAAAPEPEPEPETDSGLFF